MLIQKKINPKVFRPLFESGEFFEYFENTNKSKYSPLLSLKNYPFMILLLNLPKNIIVWELVEQACQVLVIFDISYVVQRDRRAVARFCVDFVCPLAR